MFRTLFHGVSLLPFLNGPIPQLPRIIPNFFPPHHELELLSLALKMVQRQEVFEVPAWWPLLTSPFFKVSKKDGSSRPILDLRWLNALLTCPSYSLPTITYVMRHIPQGSFCAVLDVKSGFTHILLDLLTSRLCCFQIAGRVFAFRCLPFGLSISPFLFSMMMNPLVQLWASKGIQSICYVDDLIVYASTAQELRKKLFTITMDLERLGITLNLKKSDLRPSQTVEYLGFRIDTQNLTLAVPTKKLRSVRHRIRQLATSNGYTTPRNAQSLMGTLNHLAQVFLWLPGILRPFQVQVSSAVKVALNSGLQSYQAWGTKTLFLSGESRRRLRLAASLLVPDSCRSFIPPQLALYTDASLSGFGYALPRMEEFGSCQWPQTLQIPLMDSLHSQELSITVLEALASLFSLQKLAPTLASSSLILFVDNLTLAQCIASGRAKTPILSTICGLIHLLASQHEIALTPIWIPTFSNTMADELSRMRPSVHGRRPPSNWCYGPVQHLELSYSIEVRGGDWSKRTMQILMSSPLQPGRI